MKYIIDDNDIIVLNSEGYEIYYKIYYIVVGGENDGNVISSSGMSEYDKFGLRISYSIII